MSRLSYLSEHSAAAVCKGPSSLSARYLPGGEDDVSSSLSPHRERSLCCWLTSAGRPFLFIDGEKRRRYTLRK
ncbi:hypothetical protein IE987_20555 [Klebsiella pneumoniae]|uniref:Uncharacterized protein n=1 Tax=Klebsiella pneumoniae TaxID=573 RepID=A0A927DKT5_KLEPN|nr:hypothetical protein [Klebsiella pneumoniae]